MNIYFVRHAESEGNITRIEHNDGVFLTENGKKQATSVANKLLRVPIEVILSSTYSRAKQTAEILSDTLKKEVIFTDTLIERVVPSEIVGKHMQDEYVQSVYNLLRENFRKENGRHSDEENFEDLKERAIKALDFIKNQPHENVLVVTHGSFLRVLLACMIFGKDITGHEFARTHRAFKNNNTGITFVQYKMAESPLKNDWIIHAWNDHSHLADVSAREKDQE